MMSIKSLHINTDEGPTPPSDWSGFYKFTRSGDKYELLDGNLILAQVRRSESRRNEQHYYFHTLCLCCRL